MDNADLERVPYGLECIEVGEWFNCVKYEENWLEALEKLLNAPSVVERSDPFGRHCIAKTRRSERVHLRTDEVASSIKDGGVYVVVKIKFLIVEERRYERLVHGE